MNSKTMSNLNEFSRSREKRRAMFIQGGTFIPDSRVFTLLRVSSIYVLVKEENL